MKHAFSIIRTILIKLLAHMLCTLCKRTRVEFETNGIHILVDIIAPSQKRDCATKDDSRVRNETRVKERCYDCKSVEVSTKPGSRKG